MLKLAFFQVKCLVLALLVVNSEALFLDRLFQFLLRCPADRNEAWTYRGRKGPEYWPNTYPACSGDSQSPIEIFNDRAEKDENLEKLILNNYNIPVSEGTIENNGHTIEVVPADGVVRTIVVNGETYELQQFHFHWGQDSESGSEHLLDGKSYPVEVHFVHASEDRKLAVFGVFLEEQTEANEALQTVVDELRNVKYKNQETELKSPLNLNNLLPENPASFYRYSGSLTTPGCTEGVAWSVGKKIGVIGETQLAEFRKLFSATKRNAAPTCTLGPNYRPVQPLNDRQVYLSQ